MTEVRSKKLILIIDESLPTPPDFFETLSRIKIQLQGIGICTPPGCVDVMARNVYPPASKPKSMKTPKQRRGFAAMKPAMQLRIASMGGQAISRDRQHMSAIGAKGGKRMHRNARAAVAKTKRTK